MPAPPLTFMFLELLLGEADVLVGEVGHELLVLLLQLSNLRKEVLCFPSPHILHQLQLLQRQGASMGSLITCPGQQPHPPHPRPSGAAQRCWSFGVVPFSTRTRNQQVSSSGITSPRGNFTKTRRCPFSGQSLHLHC